MKFLFQLHYLPFFPDLSSPTHSVNVRIKKGIKRRKERRTSHVDAGDAMMTSDGTPKIAALMTSLPA